MSLYELQRNALVNKLNEFNANYRHLIVDDTTYPIIKELLEEEVLNFCYTFHKIDDEDRSLSRESSLYILDPVPIYSISCLIADFSKGKRYNDSIVCFLPGLNRHVMKRLEACKFLMESCHGKFQKIEFLSLNPIEDKVYVTDNHNSIPGYYNFQSVGGDAAEYQIDKAIESMLSLCILTNEYPVVRYFNSPVSKKLATVFQSKLDDYYRKNPDLSPINNKTVMLITDRSMDMFGPFCHSKYYRSGVYDLVTDGMQGFSRGDYTYIWEYEAQTGAGLEKKHLLFDHEDPIYTELKDLQVEEFSKRIVELLNELKKEDAKFSNLKYVSDLTHATLTQKEHLTKKQLITGHFKLVEKITNEFQNKDILDLIVFENMCASNMGTNKELFEPVTDELIKLLANEKVDMADKIRLLIVYAIYRGGIVESDLVKLLKFALPEKIESITALFKNFEKFGLQLIKPSLTAKPFPRSTYHDINDTTELTERYVPSFTNIITRLANDRLPEVYKTQLNERNYYRAEDGLDDSEHKDFPYVKGVSIEELDPERNGSSSSLPTRKQPQWKTSKQTKTQLSRQKLLLFCAGGLTYFELSTILSQEAAINKSVFIGTDELYTTLDLIGDIRLIDDARAELNLSLDKKLDKKRRVPMHLFEKSAPAPPKQQPKMRPPPASTNNRAPQQQHRPSATSTVTTASPSPSPSLKVSPPSHTNSADSSTSSSTTKKHRLRSKFKW